MGIAVRPRVVDRQALALDRLWRQFRDLCGAAWSLRVAERVNASAKIAGLPVTLGWTGFITHDGKTIDSLPVEMQNSITENLCSLLRRFVSRSWIDRRLNG
jgi:hypothetical protein